jgi:hypothetical protein
VAPPDRASGTPPPDDSEALRRAAEEQVQRNAEALRRFALPIAAEPAFVFRP